MALPKIGELSSRFTKNDGSSRYLRVACRIIGFEGLTESGNDGFSTASLELRLKQSGEFFIIIDSYKSEPGTQLTIPTGVLPKEVTSAAHSQVKINPSVQTSHDDDWDDWTSCIATQSSYASVIPSIRPLLFHNCVLKLEAFTGWWTGTIHFGYIIEAGEGRRGLDYVHTSPSSCALWGMIIVPKEPVVTFLGDKMSLVTWAGRKKQCDPLIPQGSWWEDNHKSMGPGCWWEGPSSIWGPEEVSTLEPSGVEIYLGPASQEAFALTKCNTSDRTTPSKNTWVQSKLQ